LVLGRTLLPDEYGAYNSIVSLMVIISTPIAVLPLILAKYTIVLSQINICMVKRLFINSIIFVALLYLAMLVFGVIVSDSIKSFLHISKYLDIYLMFIWFGLSLIFPVLYGVLQGMHKYVIYGVGLLSTSIARVIFMVVMVVYLDAGISGALFSEVLGMLIALFIGFWALSGLLKVKACDLNNGQYTDILKYAFPVFLSSSLISLFGNIDLILVRHYCEPNDAGMYSAALVLGRIAMFLPGVLVSVLYPEISRIHEKGNTGASKLFFTIIITSIISGGIAVLFNFKPVLIIELFFGEKYAESPVLLGHISIAMAALSVSNVIFMYALARSKFSFIWILFVGVVLMIGIMYFNGGVLELYSKTLMYTCAAILVMSLIWLAFILRKKT